MDPASPDGKQSITMRSIRESVLWEQNYTELKRLQASQINRFIAIDFFDAFWSAPKSPAIPSGSALDQAVSGLWRGLWRHKNVSIQNVVPCLQAGRSAGLFRHDSARPPVLAGTQMRICAKALSVELLQAEGLSFLDGRCGPLRVECKRLPNLKHFRSVPAGETCEKRTFKF